MRGGEVFVPKIPSTRVIDLAKAIAPQAELEVIGIRPGENLHEVRVHEDEARVTVELDDMFVVQPTIELWFGHDWQERGRSLPEGFRYASDTNPQWLDADQIRGIVHEFEREGGKTVKD
jgi:UDP-N-acetylglucosamine 4,6-dehydratase